MDKKVPRVIATDPEVAHVGQSVRELKQEEEAKQTEVFDSYIMDFEYLNRAKYDAKKGVFKLFSKRGENKIVGATIVGGPAGDLI